MEGRVRKHEKIMGFVTCNIYNLERARKLLASYGFAASNLLGWKCMPGGSATILSIYLVHTFWCIPCPDSSATGGLLVMTSEQLTGWHDLDGLSPLAPGLGAIEVTNGHSHQSHGKQPPISWALPSGWSWLNNTALRTLRTGLWCAILAMSRSRLT